MQYLHICSFLRNFPNPRQRRLKLPSLSSEQSICTKTHLETGIVFNLNYGLEQMAEEMCSHSPWRSQSAAAQKVLIWSVPVSGMARDAQMGHSPLLLILYKPLSSNRKFYRTIPLPAHLELGSKRNWKQL